MQPLKGQIDWGALHARLALAAKAVAESRELSAERRGAIFAERARRHAGHPERAREGRKVLSVVEFRLAGEKYALDCSLVIEVAALGEYAPLPDAPAFVLGVTSIRGRMVSVLDLGRFFDLPSVGLTDRNRVLVLRLDDMELGLLADAVDSVSQVFWDELEPGLPTLTGPRERLCRGILPGGRVLLDAANLIEETAVSNQRRRGDMNS